MNNDGYINLARKILTDENFDEKHQFSKREAYIDLILLSSFSDKQFTASIRYLSDRWQWSKTKVGDYLLWLEKRGYITVGRTATRTETRTLQTLVNTAFANTSPDTNADSNADTKEKKEERSKEESQRNTPYYINNSPPPEKRFVKPTVEEVRQYCQQRGNKVNAEQFVDFYASKGWKVGNQPMKDWKACVRTWEIKDRRSNSTAAPVKKTAFHNFEERHTDYDALFANMQKTRGVV